MKEINPDHLIKRDVQKKENLEDINFLEVQGPPRTIKLQDLKDFFSEEWISNIFSEDIFSKGTGEMEVLHPGVIKISEKAYLGEYSFEEQKELANKIGYKIPTALEFLWVELSKRKDKEDGLLKYPYRIRTDSKDSYGDPVAFSLTEPQGQISMSAGYSDTKGTDWQKVHFITK